MKELFKYLIKYKTLSPPHASTKKILVSIICDECGISLTEKSISFSRGGVHITCHPTVRSELVCCAPRILSILHREHNIHLAFIR